MAVAALNPTQLHLLKMFSYARTESALSDIKDALTQYFADKVDEEMDKLWDEGNGIMRKMRKSSKNI